MVNKKAVIICSIIALIVVGAIVGFKIRQFKNIQYVASNSISNTTKTNTSSNTTNNQKNNENTVEEENTTNEIQNSLEENTTKAENEQNQAKGEEESEENNNTDTNADENPDEIALNLVKKEWGEDNTVYYTIDTKSGNKYIISVRSKSTTAQLAEYEADIKEKTVIIK